MNCHHRSMPSLSSSISSNDTSSPRTSSSEYSQYFHNTNLKHSSSLKLITKIQQEPNLKRFSEPLPSVPTTPKVKRWDDSQLEMELAEDDLIQSGQKKVRRNSSLRLKEKLQLSESFIKEKFRHHKKEDDVLVTTIKHKKLSKSFRKVYDWLF
ncbi:uncharacterized protein B0P05DRAFT_545349 [Gilbertella persicaria]|uniref:uncharacterized protein n=1 Tax=Gilbertella persicaria TaxID=101096 RepID=UPI00221ED0BE|nr:uncharacterized protein B0P05DRAFT_545349 [Gilbertella persicaria]KAI8076657.1 hypothetical protein B0P05DRAFT_545349 [Gilbertella persicaria]